MRRFPTFDRASSPALVVAVLAASTAVLSTTWTAACDVPVFRWALERWGAQDPDECYVATVFHRGPLEAPSAAMVEGLRKISWTEEGPSNIVLETVDLAGEPGAESKALWEGQEGATLPWLALRYPAVSRIPVLAWAGSLAEADAARLAESPLRKEISRRILSGDAAVWTLVECGDAEKDERARKTLERELQRIGRTLELPPPVDPYAGFEPIEEPSGKAAPPAEHPSFSVAILRKGDPAEATLRTLLLRSEKDLEQDAAAEPAAFPFFGRGRVLYALVGAGINGDNLEEACGYIVGRCSCEFKMMNPGLDIPFAVDWSSVSSTPTITAAEIIDLAAPAAPPAVPPPDAAAGAGSAPGSPARLADPSGAPASSSPRETLIRNLALALAGLVLVVGASALALRRRAAR